MLSRACEFVILYCVISTKLLVPTYQTHRRTHPHLMLHRCYCVEASCNYLKYKRKMSWYKLQRDIRYIIQYLFETDLEEMIVNIIQQGCHMNMVVHYAVMVQPPVDIQGVSRLRA